MKKTDLTREISRRIIEERQKRGWSQADLARECLKDRQAIAKWESGTVNTSIYALYEMAEAMGISLHTLTTIEERKKEPSGKKKQQDEPAPEPGTPVTVV